MLPILFVCVASEFMQMRQYLDHFNPHSRTSINQTIYIGHKYSNVTSTLILFLGGRAPIRSYNIESNILTSLAKETESLIIGLEHRCFGASKPPGGLVPDQLRFCTIEQALADIDDFLQYANSKLCTDVCRTVIVGSSYSGALATWFRVRYPQSSAGAWASSAPLEMKTAFPEYDLFVANRLDNISTGCLNKTKTVMDILHTTISTGDTQAISELKRTFGFNETQDDISFLYVVAEVFATAVENVDTMLDLVNDHCQAITANPSVSVLASSFQTIIKRMKATPESLDPLLFERDSDDRAKLYMSCNQIGQFPTASGELRSSFVNMSFFNRVCQRQFGMNASNASLTDMRFGGVDPRVSSAVFTNGENDPWSQLSVATSETVMGRTALFVFGGGKSTDLFYEGEESYSLQVVREICTRKMRQWVLNECEKRCHMGECVLQKCVCIDMWDGEFCDQQTHTLVAFRTVTSLCIVIPTVILILISVTVWACGSRDETAHLRRVDEFM